MSYFSLTDRVPEVSALEPRVLAWYYRLIARSPLVRMTHRRFVAGALSTGVEKGYGLDLGTGPGYVAVEIARRRPGLRLVGLDLAAHMVRYARKRALRVGLDGNALWPQADGHHLPFADGTFDLVVSSFALHHWDDPLRILNEIARVLRRPEPGKGWPGGRYYISDLCRDVSLVQRMVAYASILAISLPFGSYWAYGGYYESVRAGYTLEEFKALLGRSMLPRGEVRLESTCFVPIVGVSSRREA